MHWQLCNLPAAISLDCFDCSTHELLSTKGGLWPPNNISITKISIPTAIVLNLVLLDLSQRNHFYQAKTLNGISSALEIESTPMALGPTVQLGLAIGRRQEKIER